MLQLKEIYVKASQYQSTVARENLFCLLWSGDFSMRPQGPHEKIDIAEFCSHKSVYGTGKLIKLESKATEPI